MFYVLLYLRCDHRWDHQKVKLLRRNKEQRRFKQKYIDVEKLFTLKENLIDVVHRKHKSLNVLMNHPIRTLF